MNDKNKYIEEYLKNSLKNIISISVDNEIEKKVREFENQLIDRRNQYIAEIMKGIQIIQEQDTMLNCMNYKIIFENIKNKVE